MKKALPILLLVLIVVLSGCTGYGDSDDALEAGNSSVHERTNLNLDGKIVDVKFDRENYIAGEKVTAKLLVANAGTETITNETVVVKAKVIKLGDFLANMFLKTMSDEKKTRTFIINFTNEIEPKSIESLIAVFSTQQEMEGRSLAGTYEIKLDLFVNGQWADSEVLPVTLHPGTPVEYTPIPTPTATPIATPTPAPTSAPINTVMPTPTPTPTPTPEAVVVATPTGVSHYSRVKAKIFQEPVVEIYAGDKIMWDNHDEIVYTIVEMNNKVSNITLKDLVRTTYVFNKTGDYTFGLYYQFMKTDPSTQTIKVRVNTTNTS